MPRDRYREFSEEGRDLAVLGPQILGSKVRSDIAVINDYDNEWAYDHQYFTDEVNRDAGVHMRADLIDLFEAASGRGYGIDFVPPAADLSKYKLVIAPRQTIVDASLAERFRRFVNGGGTLIVSAHAGVKDRDNAMPGSTPPGLLADLFGVEIHTFQCYKKPSAGANSIVFAEGGASLPVHVMAEVLSPRDGAGVRVVANWGKDFFEGRPACAERASGQGKAIYFGSFLTPESAGMLLDRYATAAGVLPVLPSVPKDVEVTARARGDTHWYFLLNHAKDERTLSLPPDRKFVDAITGVEVINEIKLHSHAYRVLRVDPM